MLKKCLLYLLYIFIVGCVSSNCQMSDPQIKSKFVLNNPSWNTYIELVLKEKDKALGVEQESLSIVNDVLLTNNLSKKIVNIAEIKDFVEKQKFLSVVLPEDKQKSIEIMWKKLTVTRENVLYTSVVIASLQTQWQEDIKKCILGKNEKEIQEKLKKMPTIYFLERKIRNLDVLYDVCHQLSIKNFDIAAPY